MLATAVFLALTAAFIGGLIVFWRNIVEWIKKAVNKIKEVLNIIVEGTRTFIEKTTDGLRNKSKYYNKNKMTAEWEETVYTKQVDESEVPPEILAKLHKVNRLNVEVSTTEELALAIHA